MNWKMNTSRYLRFHAIDFQKRFAHFLKTLKNELLGFAMQHENYISIYACYLGKFLFAQNKFLVQKRLGAIGSILYGIFLKTFN